MIKESIKKDKITPVLLILFNALLVVAFYNTPQAQSQMLEDFKNRRFIDVQKETIDCLLTDFDSMPDCDLFDGAVDYRVLEYISLHGNCFNETWDDRVKQRCAQDLLLDPKTLESEESLAAYQTTVGALGAAPRLAVVAAAIFFKDPSRCDAISKEENRLRHFRCRAFSSAEGANECLRNFEEGDPVREACINDYTFFTAVRTKNITACKNITENQQRFVCEALIMGSETARDEMKRNSMNEDCMMRHALSLAVVGALDPGGLRNASAYCDTIPDPTAHKKCRELVDSEGALDPDGRPDPGAYCDKIPYRIDLNINFHKQCKDLVDAAKAFLRSRAPGNNPNEKF